MDSITPPPLPEHTLHSPIDINPLPVDNRSKRISQSNTEEENSGLDFVFSESNSIEENLEIQEDVDMGGEESIEMIYGSYIEPGRRDTDEFDPNDFLMYRVFKLLTVFLYFSYIFIVGSILLYTSVQDAQACSIMFWVYVEIVILGLAFFIKIFYLYAQIRKKSSWSGRNNRFFK
eukprot:TRINITY_DN2086_c0_g1_i1.p1 TRINITY_DN2086_c0_g1~~TRINITY_DN2086_c0_g1_i1.p1  ORF type:complete len:175 (-),score=44.41 TRINITY_DN2086_c0_g1_i1:550-1074(-)